MTLNIYLCVVLGISCWYTLYPNSKLTLTLTPEQWLPYHCPSPACTVTTDCWSSSSDNLTAFVRQPFCRIVRRWYVSCVSHQCPSIVPSLSHVRPLLVWVTTHCWSSSSEWQSYNVSKATILSNCVRGGSAVDSVSLFYRREVKEQWNSIIEYYIQTLESKSCTAHQ